MSARTIQEYNRLMLEKRIVENELALIKLELKKIEISNEMSGEPVNLKKEIMRIKRRNKRARKKVAHDLSNVRL